jgi:drug/metabolite transporter (DMT)-like permease
MFLIFLGLIWGGSFPAVEVALDGFGPLGIAAGRIGLAAALLTGLAFATGAGLPATGSARGRRIWLHCIGMGIFSNALPFSLLSWGQRQVTSGFAGITMAVVPLLVLPLAHVFVPGERLTPQKAAGFLIGFAGVVLLVGTGGQGPSGAPALARLACIAASSCYAVGAIVTRLAPPGPYLAFSAGSLLVASAVMLPLALVVEGWPPTPPPASIAAIAYLGVFPTALATVMLVYIVQAAGPSFMSLVNYQVPVWAVILGLLFLGEDLPAQFLGALALILLGLAISQVESAAGRAPPAGDAPQLRCASAAAPVRLLRWQARDRNHLNPR